jgi:hypothetical protein
MVRKYTNKLLEMIEEGVVDKDQLIIACLLYMSEDDVESMMRECDIIFDEDEEDDYQPDELQEWQDFDPDC